MTGLMTMTDEQAERITAFLAAWRESEEFRGVAAQQSTAYWDRDTEQMALRRAIALEVKTAAHFGVDPGDVRPAGRVLSTLLED